MKPVTPTTEDDSRDGLPSASQADRLHHCAGSWQASQSPTARSSESPLALAGTRIHDALETDDDEDLEVDEATIKERLQQIEAKALQQWQVARNINVPPSVIREERLYFRARKTLEPLATARLDVAYLTEKAALIINYKTGYKKASDARGSWQLRTEMLCLWHDIKSIEHIRVAFAQARIGSSFSYCDYDLADMRHSEAELYHLLWRINLPDAPRVPGPQCTFCPAAHECVPAAIYAALTQYQVMTAGGFDKLEPAAQKVIWERKGPTEAIFEAIAKNLKALPPDQLAALGLALESTGSVRWVTDPQKLFDILFEAGLLDPENPVKDFTAFTKVMIGKAEKAVLPKLAEKQSLNKTEAAKALAKLIDPVVGKKEKAHSLTLATESQRAVGTPLERKGNDISTAR